MNYAVYIATPHGETAERIAAAAKAVVLPASQFRVREHGDPNAAGGGELFFRMEGVASPEEALAGALLVYEAARESAGLRHDSRAEPSLEPAARSKPV